MVEDLERESKKIDGQIKIDMAQRSENLRNDLSVWPIKQVLDNLLDLYNPKDYTGEQLLGNKR